MANKTLFNRIRLALQAADVEIKQPAPAANARNAHNAPAYALTPEQALAQVAMTGCLNQTYYASGEAQLDTILTAAKACSPLFVAQTAVYARKQGLMKDVPAFLAAYLVATDGPLVDRIFDRVVDNGKMLRNFVQILRSGAVGRKSLGSRARRLVRHWLEARADIQVFEAVVGNEPSLQDILKLAHPKPGNAAREALYRYLLGREVDLALLPERVQQLEAFKAGKSSMVPDVPFQLLTNHELNAKAWTAIAERASWQTTRMNLNTFLRHGVFTDSAVVRLVARKLSNPDLVRASKCFPYQLLTAFQNVDEQVPRAIKEALQDAMEVAVENVPKLEGQVYVLVDVSGSMQSPVTGYREGSSSKTRCVDVAGLMAAAILRRNPSAEVIPFETDVVELKLNSRDSVMTNAQRLAAVGGGGTNCSAPLKMLNKQKAKGDVIIYVSDNESWVDARRGAGATATMNEWTAFKARNPMARLINIDLQPYRTVQVADRPSILNIGGFSDQVFQVVSAFASGQFGGNGWVEAIQKVAV